VIHNSTLLSDPCTAEKRGTYNKRQTTTSQIIQENKSAAQSSFTKLNGLTAWRRSSFPIPVKVEKLLHVASLSDFIE
jgi:hypothetical protein